MRSISTYSTVLVIIFLFFFSSSRLAQTTVPAQATSCTSKDLEIVAAKLTGGDLWNSCINATALTRTLTLSIKNTGGSTGGAAAFWGTVEKYSSLDGSLCYCSPLL